jgi:hypothetical protein
MSRQHVISGKPELDQIGELANVDISPIYEMEKYWDDDSAKHQLSFANNQTERDQILKRIQADKDNLKGNINIVLKTIDSLILNLTHIDNLDKRLDNNGEDTLGYEFYFTDFDKDKGEGYIDNNFGQDLRNFKRFLVFAKEYGATTVWFNYG